MLPRIYLAIRSLPNYNPSMRTIWEGHLTGEFHGYKGGRVYELSDGTRWRQECRTEEPIYRERPKVRLLRDEGTGLLHLDVDGTSGVVRVEQELFSRSWGCG